MNILDSVKNDPNDHKTPFECLKLNARTKSIISL